MSLNLFDQSFWFPVLQPQILKAWQDQKFVLCYLLNNYSQLPPKESYLVQSEILEWESYQLNPLRQNQYLHSRWMLKTCLSSLLKCHPMDLFFQKGPLGKPILDPKIISSLGVVSQSIDFNLSHTAEVSLLGISQNKLIGVDVEKLESRKSKKDVARRFFHSTEYEWIQKASSENEKESRFYRLWSLKESIIKTIGGGVFQNINDFYLEINDLTQESKVTINSNKEPWSNKSSWIIYETKELTQHVCSLALYGS